MCDDVYKTVYTEAHAFLMERIGPGPLMNQLMLEPKPAPRNMRDVYRNLINAVPGSNRMRDAVEPVECMAGLLIDFDPVKVYSRYGDNWEKLFEGVKDLKDTDPDPDKDDNLLELFCIAVLSGASFLSQLRSLKTFKAFIDGFGYNEMSTAVLPLLLQKEIIGLGFHSACMFLDDCGYPDYVQPDQKIKAMMCDIGLIEYRDNYDALKALILTARANDITPAVAHKLLRLIASGHLRQAFIDHVTPILGPMLQS